MIRIAIVSALALAACGAAQVRTEEDLGDSVRQYNDGVRWGRYEVAASSLPPADRSRFVDDMDQRANDVKITDYDVVRVDRHGDGATVHIKMSWYKDTEGTVHETHAMQSWEHRGKLWLMVEERRLRGAEMPGLAEPIDKDKDKDTDKAKGPTAHADPKTP